ncbi:MAG: hypothetical protein JRF64_04595, partial [Deltaproteobacteria bacterium]|nr:hypothetical protein [Deltaproteobacteria bacterium]
DEREQNEAEQENAFLFEGDFWAVYYNGNRTQFRDLERLRYVIHLLDKPRREFYANELISLVKGQRANAGKGGVKVERVAE